MQKCHLSKVMYRQNSKKVTGEKIQVRVGLIKLSKKHIVYTRTDVSTKNEQTYTNIFSWFLVLVPTDNNRWYGEPTLH